MQHGSCVDEDLTLATLLRNTNQVIGKFREKELSQFNISSRQAEVLFYVQILGDQATIRELSRWTFRDYRTTSGILNRMERDGLVSRGKGSGRNATIFVLTTKGQEVFLLSTKRASIHKVMSCLSEKERQKLRSYLEKLQDEALKEIGLHSRPPLP